MVAVLGLIVPAQVHAAPGNRRKPEAGLERSQAFVEEGDESLERGDYEEAVAKYSAAYYGLDTVNRVSYMGSIPVRKAMRAYDLLVAQEQDRAVLERQLGLVTEFLESVKSRPDGAERVGEQIITELETVRAAVEKKIAALADASAPHATDPQEPEDGETEEPADEEPAEPSDAESTEFVPSAEPPPTGDEPPKPSRSPLGIGLAAGGGVLLGTGLGVVAGWWTVRNQAVDYADAEPGYEEGTQARGDYLAGEEDRARRYLIAGSVLAGVGAATLTTGVALILLKKRAGSEPAVAFSPQVTPSLAGLAVRGRF